MCPGGITFLSLTEKGRPHSNRMLSQIFHSTILHGWVLECLCGKKDKVHVSYGKASLFTSTHLYLLCVKKNIIHQGWRIINRSSLKMLFGMKDLSMTDILLTQLLQIKFILVFNLLAEVTRFGFKIALVEFIMLSIFTNSPGPSNTKYKSLLIHHHIA